MARLRWPAMVPRVRARLDQEGLPALAQRLRRARWRGALALPGSEASPAASLLPPRQPVADLLEDDAAVAAHILAVLHASAIDGALRAELGAALEVVPERIAAGWAYLRLRAPSGLRFQRDAARESPVEGSYRRHRPASAAVLEMAREDDQFVVPASWGV